MFFEPPDPLWYVKNVHPGYTMEDLRKLSEEPRAEGAGVYPTAAGTGKEIFESITVWNPQCKDYAFEVRWITKTEMNRQPTTDWCSLGIAIRPLVSPTPIQHHSISQPFPH
jgi:hypothetical protein